MNEKPLRSLPTYFDSWWNIAKDHGDFLKDGTFRKTVRQMPYLDYSRLGGEAEWRLAHTILCCITQCYVWVEGEENIPQCLPRNIAVPLWEVSQHLGVTVSICQFNFILHNWTLVDPDGPMTADNMRPIIQISDGQDEAGFLMVGGQVEVECGPALCGIVEAQQAIKDLDVNKYILALGKMETAIRKMRQAFLRMRDLCRPWYFYNVIRPFQAGTDSPAFKNKGWKGLVFEGVSSEPVSYSGGSAAQSSALQALDAALGITHAQTEEELCTKFRQYMPPKHRRFISAVANGPSIREFATFSKNSRALQMYNLCLKAIKDFRSSHIQICTEYIVAMSHRNDALKKYEHQAEVGTGGTGFMSFLKGLRCSVDVAMHEDVDGTEIN